MPENMDQNKSECWRFSGGDRFTEKYNIIKNVYKKIHWLESMVFEIEFNNPMSSWYSHQKEVKWIKIWIIET